MKGRSNSERTVLDDTCVPSLPCPAFSAHQREGLDNFNRLGRVHLVYRILNLVITSKAVEKLTTRLGFIGGKPGMGRPFTRSVKRFTSWSALLSCKTTGYVGRAAKLGSVGVVSVVCV